MLNSLIFDETMNDLFRRMNRVGAPPALGGAFADQPRLNVWRNADSLAFEAELPGYRMEDIEILATEDTLTIKGRREAQIPEGAKALRLERKGAQFHRSFTLPLPVDADGAEATLRDGVLRITLPLARSAKPTRINVTSGGANDSLPVSETTEVVEREPAVAGA